MGVGSPKSSSPSPTAAATLLHREMGEWSMAGLTAGAHLR